MHAFRCRVSGRHKRTSKTLWLTSWSTSSHAHTITAISFLSSVHSSIGVRLCCNDQVRWSSHSRSTFLGILISNNMLRDSTSVWCICGPCSIRCALTNGMQSCHSFLCWNCMWEDCFKLVCTSVISFSKQRHCVETMVLPCLCFAHYLTQLNDNLHAVNNEWTQTMMVCTCKLSCLQIHISVSLPTLLRCQCSYTVAACLLQNWTALLVNTGFALYTKCVSIDLVSCLQCRCSWDYRKDWAFDNRFLGSPYDRTNSQFNNSSR